MEKSVGAVLRNLNGPVLVTGHTGFKGTWLTRYLAHLDVEVVGFSLPIQGDELYVRANLQGQIKEKFSDICDLDSIRSFIKSTKPGAIIHLAAQPLVLESYLDPINTFNTNVMGTANLLEAARKSEQTHGIMIVTTDKVYQNKDKNEKFRETSSLLGKDPYSASKVGAENVAIAWRNLLFNGGVSNISVARSGNVIGGGDYSKNRLMPDIVRAHENNKVLEIRNPESTRPWQHVLDPLHGYILALERSISMLDPDTYNFGPSQLSLSVREVMANTQEVWPDIKYRILNKETGYESKYLDLDSSHAQAKLNWKPKYSQEDAIKLTLQWWDDVLKNKVAPQDAISNDINHFNC
jgi:CDP-glucose 4,6-dehydratase